jgi:uncharacterized protein YdeI (BOF family)
MQINISFNEANRRMNTKYLVVVAAMAVMLVAATALATDNAFADKNRKHDGKGGYKKTQAASQVNDCGNGDTPIDVFCQNLASQIQGDGNAAVLDADQS